MFFFFFSFLSIDGNNEETPHGPQTYKNKRLKLPTKQITKDVITTTTTTTITDVPDMVTGKLL